MENKGSEPFKSMIDYINCRQNQLEVLDKKIRETELSDKEWHAELIRRRDWAALEINSLITLNQDLIEEVLGIIGKFKEDYSARGVAEGRKNELVENLCKDFQKIFGYEED